jgi:uncharacterized protein YegP (UPF0339 family)
MATGDSDNFLVESYRTRFSEPLTDDEAYGYWLFLVSILVGTVGILVALTTLGGQANATREAGFALAALGLAGALTGLVVGQSFNRGAKYLVYLGAILSVAGVVWFTTVYPDSWTYGTDAVRNVIILYTAGVALVAVAGAIAPVVVGQSRARRAAERALAGARQEAEAAREETAAAREETETARETADAERTRADEAEAHLTKLYDSNATFQMYEDRSEQWRWRLVHRNGNIVATGGEGYASDRNARRGMRSVKRNALGADVFWDRTETEPEPEPDPVAEESRATFELYVDEAGEDRWRLRHDNGEIVAAAARGFSSKSGARDAIESVRTYAGPADYLEFDPAAFEVYEDAGGEYRWRLVHRNGRIMADSGEGYTTRSNARRAVEAVVETIDGAEIGAGAGERFEIYEDSAGEHRWRLVSSNDEIVADSGEGYSSRSEAANAVERVETYAPEADTLTVGEAAIEIFEDGAGEHRWRLRHRNGTILATGGEGYSDRSGAVDGVNSVKRNAPGADVVEEE